MGFDAQDVASLQQKVQPNLPWAEDHFLERVSGEPLNPPPSEAWWPFAQQGNAAHKKAEKFSHTYPERMWPKHAGDIEAAHGELSAHGDWCINKGIRFAYGDLADVVEMLRKTPMTRQAFLPIWFPEDTGAVHGERVPCTLGYHFQVREGRIFITYYIRSCDIVRHMRDDVYMAARLAQWVAAQLPDLMIERGELTMHIANMHCFEGDRAMLQMKVRDYRAAQTQRMLGAF
jgi:thymidylate synthase